ncbi:MAG: hypothetical protein ACP5R4_01015 [Armatimonadota bacterium]
MRWLALLALAVCNSGWCAASDAVMRSMLSYPGSLKQLLNNTGFENASRGTAVGWRPYEQGYTLAVGEGRAGSNAVVCTNSTGAGRFGAYQVLQLNRKTPAPLIVTGWSKAENVSGSPSPDYSIYVDIIYTDGTPLWGQTGNFSTGTHGWERRSFVISPSKPIGTLYVYALFRGIRGRVWFDDIEVREVSAGSGQTLFDGAPMRIIQPQPAGSRAFTVNTSDGLALSMDSPTGRIVSMKLNGGEICQRGWPSGFFARDVAADSDMLSFADGGAQSIDLHLTAAVKQRGHCIEISGTLTNTKQKDRAVTLYFSLPINAIGGQWWDYIRQSRTIETGIEYRNHIQVGTGANGSMSLYPFCCVTKGKMGIAVGIDMRMPAQYRLAYNPDARSLFIAYDFALVQDNKKHPNSASFRFVIYRTRPEWGFRSAAEGFYHAFPSYFVCRSKQQGIWMPFTDVSTVQGWQDFGFMYHEGDNNVTFDDSAGILSFRYTEPMTYWMPMEKSIPRTYDNAVQVLRRNLNSKNPELRRWAQAVISSGTFNEAGRYNLELINAPWNDGAVFVLNPNPDLPESVTKANISWNAQLADQLYGPRAKGTLDGEYLDSLEGWATYRNFRRSHFAFASVPLTYTTDTKTPCILQIFSTYEFANRISDDLHRRGKLVFANGTPWRFPFLSALLDVMGTETNWFQGDRWIPEDDALFCLRRTMCYKKPYLLLMNTNYDRMTPSYVEDYFRRCLFYGVFPSMFSHNAAENPYWQNPKWYNRDRPLFKRYIPIIKRIAEAGWEPITGFKANDGRVLLERFGPGEDKHLYLTAMNTSSERVKTTVSASKQEIGGVEITSVENLLDTGYIKLLSSGEHVMAELTLEAGEIAAFAFTASTP